MESCTVLQFKGMEGREKVNVEVDWGGRRNNRGKYICKGIKSEIHNMKSGLSARQTGLKLSVGEFIIRPLVQLYIEVTQTDQTIWGILLIIEICSHMLNVCHLSPLLDNTSCNQICLFLYFSLFHIHISLTFWKRESSSSVLTLFARLTLALGRVKVIRRYQPHYWYPPPPHKC